MKNIWIHQHDKKGWRKYWLPKWLNVTASVGQPKICRWLFLGFTWGKVKESEALSL